MKDLDKLAEKFGLYDSSPDASETLKHIREEGLKLIAYETLL